MVEKTFKDIENNTEISGGAFNHTSVKRAVDNGIDLSYYRAYRLEDKEIVDFVDTLLIRIFSQVYQRLKPIEFFEKMLDFSPHTMLSIFKHGFNGVIVYNKKTSYDNIKLREGLKKSLELLLPLLKDEEKLLFGADYYNNATIYKIISNADSNIEKRLKEEFKDDYDVVSVNFNNNSNRKIDLYLQMISIFKKLKEIEQDVLVNNKLSQTMHIKISELRNRESKLGAKDLMNDIVEGMSGIKKGLQNVILTDKDDEILTGFDNSSIVNNSKQLKEVYYNQLTQLTGLPASVFTGEALTGLGNSASSTNNLLVEESAYKTFFNVYFKECFFSFLNASVSCHLSAPAILMIAPQLQTIEYIPKIDSKEFYRDLGLPVIDKDESDDEQIDVEKDNLNDEAEF